MTGRRMDLKKVQQSSFVNLDSYCINTVMKTQYRLNMIQLLVDGLVKK